MTEFVIFTQSNCNFCTRAKELITAKGDSFTERSLDDLSDLLRTTFKKTYETVPQVFKDGLRIGGHDDLQSYYAGRGSVTA